MENVLVRITSGFIELPGGEWCIEIENGKTWLTHQMHGERRLLSHFIPDYGDFIKGVDLGTPDKPVMLGLDNFMDVLSEINKEIVQPVIE